MKYELVKYDGYNLHLVNSNKSKNIYITVNLGTKFNKDNYYKICIMNDLLTETTKTYNTKREMQLHLEDLYGTRIFSDAGREGSYFISSINATTINPKFIDDDKLYEQFISSFFECIFNPDIENNRFKESLVEQRKGYFIEKTKSNEEYPGFLISNRSEALIDPDTPLGLKPYGTIEQIESINASELVDIYKDLIDNANIDIIVGGDIDNEEIKYLVSKYAKFKKRDNKYTDVLLAPKVKIKPTIDSFVVPNNQSIYVEHYNVIDTNDYEKLYVANVFEEILGGGLDSKLSRKVRKDNSLCYSINATSVRLNGLFRIVVALEKKNVKKAQKLIKETLKEMKTNITLEELDNAKKTIINGIISTFDSVTAMMDNVFCEYALGLDPKDIKIKKYQEVKLEDVMNFADKLIINTEFLLEGCGNDEEN